LEQRFQTPFVCGDRSRVGNVTGAHYVFFEIAAGVINSGRKDHIVRVTDEARQKFQQLVQSGTRPVRVVRRTLILLKSAEGLTD
jgi:hypothetical protein